MDLIYDTLLIIFVIPFQLDDKRSGSLKDAPSFIRSSLRKLKIRRSKDRKTDGGAGGGMDSSPSLSPAPRRDVKQPRSHPASPSPKKSPKPTKSPKSPKSPKTSGHSSNVTRDIKSNNPLEGKLMLESRMCPPEIIKAKPG